MKTLQEITSVSGVELKTIFSHVERIEYRYNHYLGYSNGEPLVNHINRYLEAQKFKPAKRKLVGKCVELFFKNPEVNILSSPLGLHSLYQIRLYNDNSWRIVYKSSLGFQEMRFPAF